MVSHVTLGDVLNICKHSKAPPQQVARHLDVVNDLRICNCDPNG
jgi:hypothetical protein